MVIIRKGYGMVAGRGVPVTEVDQPRQGAVQQLRPYEKFAHYMRQRAEVDSANTGDALSGNAMDKILTAESEDDIWDADENGLIALKDLVGAEVEFRTLKIHESTDPEKQNILGVYAICECAMLTEFRALGLQPGEVVNINTGVPTVIAKLRAFEAKNLWPVKALVTGTSSGKGEMVRIRPIPKRAVQGSTES